MSVLERLENGVRQILPRRLKGGLRQFASRYSPPPPQNVLGALVGQYCVGRGLEIGAAQNPYSDPARTIYLDKHTSNKDGTPHPDVISSADRLPLTSGAVNYVLASHVLEHMQNTIPVLREWTRVLSPGGVLFLVLPHADRTIDRFRQRTTLAHHIDDERTLTDRPDLSHHEEVRRGWSQLPDQDRLAREYREEWGADIWDFDFRVKNDVIHFHVWTQDEMVRLLQYVQLHVVVALEHVPERDDSFVVVARRP